MRLLTDTEAEKSPVSEIGGKAKGLCHLRSMGCKVPSWVVIPADDLRELVNNNSAGDPSAIRSFISKTSLPQELLIEIAEKLPGQGYYAVRSSAAEEDGTEQSFAGQFESRLFVTKHTLGESIRQVWLSAYSERAQRYRDHHGVTGGGTIAVIIQAMINADVSGVAFGIDPATGDRRSKVISAVFGLGEGLVSGELDADRYVVNRDGAISSTIAVKHHMFVQADGENGGTKRVNVEGGRQRIAALTDEQVKKLAETLETGYRISGKYQDMEFALSGGDLFVLQMRPVVQLSKIPNTTEGYVLWDNSNIVESYPGVTTPLTFSFIRSSYESAYRLFSRYMGVSQRTTERHARIYANTLGLINGRVYYNLRTWYHMLALLPGYSINARFMETMMGVKEKFDVPEEFRLSRTKAWISIIRMAVQMYSKYLQLPRKRREFITALSIIDEYRKTDLSVKSSRELMDLYLRFESSLLAEWKAPLLNDFFAMIWFGRLKKLCAGLALKNRNIHNDLLCGSSDIISTEPIHRCIRIAGMINARAEWKDLFESHDVHHVLRTIRGDQNSYGPLHAEIESYLRAFGDRCIGELKLESVSYSDDPSKLIAVIRNYVTSGISAPVAESRTDVLIRKKAEEQVAEAVRLKPWKRYRLRTTLRKARELVTARENLRYERTRAFGVVRSIFVRMGRNWFAEGILDDARDIFYLTRDEIFSFIEGTAVTQDLKKLAGLRRAEFEKFRAMDPPPERFATYGIVYHNDDHHRFAKLEAVEGDLKGTGCCPGQVKARVRVVLDPEKAPSLDGDILVTSSTDPGWVTLFPSASAIIVERGSLLSHSAIVAREMGKPCIVGVTGLLRTLHTGDLIEMDGSTGQIRIIEKIGRA